jgi:excinuclease ABC subunit A
MGPEGGAGGGTVLATGTPEHLATVPESYTGGFLREVFEAEAETAAIASQRAREERAAG